MKNYRALMPIVVIGFVGLSIYSRMTELQEQETTYLNHLQAAREYREGKIYTNALQEYQDALDMKQTYALCEEIGQMYLEEAKESNIKSWGEYMIEEYPREVAGYEYMIDFNLTKERYRECFELYDIVEKRNLYSESLERTIESIRYIYEMRTGKFVEVSEYSQSYCVGIREEGGVCGYYDINGNQILKPQYLQAGAFGREYAAVQDETGEYYFIDAQGNRKMNVPKDIEITKLGFFADERYYVGEKDKMYYADAQANLVLGPYEDATTFNGQRAAVKEGGKWYLIDLNGNKLSDGYLEFATDVKDMVYRNNVIFAKTEKGYICMDGQGTRIGNDYYEEAKCFLDTTYTAVKQNGKWGFIDNTGKFVIEPQYEDAKPFQNGMAAVKKDGLWGYININGKMAIEPVFYDANCMNENGCAYVKSEEDKWGLLRLIGGIS